MGKMAGVSLSQFNEAGYQIVPDVIEDEVIGVIRRFLESAAGRALEEIRTVIPFATTDELMAKVDELYRSGEIEALDPEIVKLLSGHLPLDSRLDPTLWAVARSAGVRGLLAQLFPGQPLHMHMPPAARYVLPGNRHAMVPAHQDVTYNKHMPDFVTVWVPFVPIDAKCAGVGVHLGTHNTPELVHSERKGFWYEPITRQSEEVISCEVPLGGVLLLSTTIIHESLGNTSDRTRYSVDYRFFGAHGSQKHYVRLDTMQVVAPEPAVASAGAN